MRIKLRKGHSTLHLEQVSPNTQVLEIIAPTLEKMGDLNKYEHLKFLYINAPELKKVPKLPLSIETLKLRSIKVDSDDLTTIQQLVHLKNLEIIDADIEVLPKGFFTFFTNIEQLTLKDNKLSSLPELTTCQKLKRVNIDNNRFEKLPESIMTQREINHLSMENNQFLEEEKNKIHKLYGIWF